MPSAYCNEIGRGVMLLVWEGGMDRGGVSAGGVNTRDSCRPEGGLLFCDISCKVL